MTSPSTLVDPLDGTGTGPVVPGAVGEFPGATLPFGMIQWSPDTVPNAGPSGGGYAYADSSVNGFSLTHLSGTGCPVYQDVPVLPTVGPVGTDPMGATDSFSHQDEEAAPGRYAVTLGPAGIKTQLSVTTRTGLASFHFPSTPQANLLFKVGDSPNPVVSSAVRILGPEEIVGQVTSGQFCQTGTDYTLHFVARFDRPASSSGTWSGSVVRPGSSVCAGNGCGAALTFDTRAVPVVRMKVGISFVSDADAMANLEHEDPGWSLSRVEHAATEHWDALLSRITVHGGTTGEQHTFYTALYHSLLEPNVVSDVNGAYAGSDGRVHHATGAAEYANFSEWDTYRSEIELEAMLAPDRVGNMVQSLVDDARQGGWLPILAIVAGDASQDSGDSADPLIASAYAFGARNFDVEGALSAMLKGASQVESGHGFEVERQYLSQYLGQHYVDAAARDLTSIDYSLGGSLTLEYALDDFSIARLAGATGHGAVAARMMQRAHNWEYLFDAAKGFVQAKGADGSFPPGPAFNPADFEPGGQLGFEEGNAIQYTWSVPEDLSALAELMGGDGTAVANLSALLTEDNAGRYQPYDWAGNEPSLWSPWEFDAFGAPWRTQAAVRDIADTLYADTPVGEPGNDDLGALSSWYVWAAVGLYPITPGTGTLALASPLFPEVQIRLGNGHRIVERAPGASAATPFVNLLRVGGVSEGSAAPSCGTSGRAPARQPVGWQQPWLPASVLTSGASLDFSLSSTPDIAWGSAAANALPSYGQGRIPAVGFTQPDGAADLTVGRPQSIELGARSAECRSRAIRWQASGAGLVVRPQHGTIVAASSANASPTTGSAGTTSLEVEAPSAGTYTLQVQLRTRGGTPLPPVVVDIQAH